MIGRKRATYVSDGEHCPRCEFGDKVDKLFIDSKISDNVRDWYSRNTNYTAKQLRLANAHCGRCSIVFTIMPRKMYNKLRVVD